MNNVRRPLKNMTYLVIGLMLTPALSFGMEQERKQEEYEDTSFGNYFDNMVEAWASEPARPKKAKEKAIKEYVPYVKPDQRLRIMLFFAKEEDKQALSAWQAEQIEIAAIACYEKLLREAKLEHTNLEA